MHIPLNELLHNTGTRLEVVEAAEVQTRGAAATGTGAAADAANAAAHAEEAPEEADLVEAVVVGAVPSEDGFEHVPGARDDMSDASGRDGRAEAELPQGNFFAELCAGRTLIELRERFGTGGEEDSDSVDEDEAERSALHLALQKITNLQWKPPPQSEWLGFVGTEQTAVVTVDNFDLIKHHFLTCFLRTCVAEPCEAHPVLRYSKSEAKKIASIASLAAKRVRAGGYEYTATTSRGAVISVAACDVRRWYTTGTRRTAPLALYGPRTARAHVTP